MSEEQIISAASGLCCLVGHSTLNRIVAQAEAAEMNKREKCHANRTDAGNDPGNMGQDHQRDA
jgi:hypothetical protein